MKVALHTLGCKLNFSETSSIGSQFLSNGFDIVDPKDQADVYVVNTCTVTESAERECRQIVRRFLRQNPEAYIIVTGCYAQLRPQEISSIKGVDAVLGSNEKFDLFSLINNFNKKELACIFVSPVDEQNEFGHAHSSDVDSRTRAYLKIQDGCDYKCTFCTIPLARGKSRSMNPDEVVLEFKKLLEKNYKEIILTGVNVGDYGKSLDTNLYELLLRLTKMDGNFRMRISSIEPNLLSDEIIELTAESNKLCKHFHIPLQSGSSIILKLMQRRYKADDYERLIHKIKKRIPDAGIGVDVIVGFPGETHEDFLITHNFLRDLPISYLHVFTYSERPNTKAIELDLKVDVHERRERNNILRILSDKKRNEFYNQMLGKEHDVVFEHENHNGLMKGFSSNYIRVSHSFNPDLVNNISQIKITGIKNGICTGKIVDTKKAVDLIVT
ncbi:MAG: tRNA (N(6)-L-threonylcarbamoyladenosine(37)-C(2))-methylthiotransferase MtaB [Ignavibacteria bacterium RIFOXYB2_FULL_35_12]|nr:MAG: tRNA (N(6)-L-threonylcarbamoyladenosine(37)-C(2))-methylthiotransferase MtaB [Ignavibacteria bacterium GWA2_36_19]OGU54271.1 MAG: tRNA (N(6)-L-threonylcarbamoyladenosine(37)-C(2))-methylthiotransferase MtaB [Ignavibacteria bacterium GWC2_35_8]OGU58148.1 MAG: tRNA (N(6)-L-threonylcarbamoyladenosine(37)-C(2))-methylthiotransferase MtaB [Ignavibacteria bacterium GWF2_35_20]OGU81854.1 MAG: tRNA (N(6)-L-threonylcarbamoyladenosine(37)-C(2))-methylthiotransferase MtaB [Ignavibacteria bacterium 